MTTHRSVGAAFCLALAALATPLLPSRATAQDVEPTPPAPAAQESHPTREQPQRRNRNRLTPEEIQASPLVTRDLYAVVQSLRPNWLRFRGDQSMNDNGSVKVYLNGMRVGSARELRDVDPRQVKSVEYMDGTTATTRYGVEHERGAILVSTI